MRAQRKAAGLGARAASKINSNNHLTARLAVTKQLLVHAYGLNALTFSEAELIGSRFRQCYGPLWRAA